MYKCIVHLTLQLIDCVSYSEVQSSSKVRAVPITLSTDTSNTKYFKMMASASINTDPYKRPCNLYIIINSVHITNELYM